MRTRKKWRIHKICVSNNKWFSFHSKEIHSRHTHTPRNAPLIIILLIVIIVIRSSSSKHQPAYDIVMTATQLCTFACSHFTQFFFLTFLIFSTWTLSCSFPSFPFFTTCSFGNFSFLFFSEIVRVVVRWYKYIYCSPYSLNKLHISRLPRHNGEIIKRKW